MGWLVSLYVPFFDLLTTGGHPPVFMAIGSDHRNDIREINKYTRNGGVESLVSRALLEKRQVRLSNTFSYTSLSQNPSQASLEILERFVIKSPEIVMTKISDLNSFIQASLYSAHFQLPLVLIDAHLNEQLLKESLEKFGIKRVITVSNKLPKILQTIPTDMVQQIRPNAVQALLINQIGTENVKNVLLATLYSQSEPENVAADVVMFIPFISYLRKAPVMLSTVGDGKTIQTRAHQFVARHGIQPRNLTILGDYSRIGAIELKKKWKKSVYKGKVKVELEPGSDYGEDEALSFGIGRLPYNSLADVSMYYARLLQHDRYYSNQNRDFVMISNVVAKKGANLKFAEAISVLTVREIRNFGLKGQAFYKSRPDEMKMWETAFKSGLVIYEGHSEYLLSYSNRGDATGSASVIPGHFENFPLLILQ